MNLSINQLSNYNKIDYYRNSSFRGKNVKAVYTRSAKEIEDLISSSKEMLTRDTNEKIENKLCDFVGKCLGDKYLYQLVGRGRASALWIAIHKDASRATDVIMNILQANESQGKTCEEIVDKMLTDLKPKKQEIFSLHGINVTEQEIINQIVSTPIKPYEKPEKFLKYYRDIKLTPRIREAINRRLESYKTVKN